MISGSGFREQAFVSETSDEIFLGVDPKVYPQ